MYFIICCIFHLLEEEEKKKVLVDVIFALGSMGTNPVELFERQKNITSSKIDKQTFPDTKYGIIVYGDLPRTHLAISNDFSNAKVKNLVEELTWISDGTRLDLALNRATGTVCLYFSEIRFE